MKEEAVSTRLNSQTLDSSIEVSSLKKWTSPKSESPSDASSESPISVVDTSHGSGRDVLEDIERGATDFRLKL